MLLIMVYLSCFFVLADSGGTCAWQPFSGSSCVFPFVVNEVVSERSTQTMCTTYNNDNIGWCPYVPVVESSTRPSQLYTTWTSCMYLCGQEVYRAATFKMDDSAITPDTVVSTFTTVKSAATECAREVLKHGGASFTYNQGDCTVYSDLQGSYDAAGQLYTYHY